MVTLTYKNVSQVCKQRLIVKKIPTHKLSVDLVGISFKVIAAACSHAGVKKSTTQFNVNKKLASIWTLQVRHFGKHSHLNTEKLTSQQFSFGEARQSSNRWGSKFVMSFLSSRELLLPTWELLDRVESRKEPKPESCVRGGDVPTIRGISHCSHLLSSGWLRKVHRWHCQDAEGCCPV